MELKFKKYSNQSTIRAIIQECEGNHKQQVVYSTYHDALTQICYGCKMVRSNVDFTIE